eukprot:8741801-Pyramimonas_sp.AAC.1
MDGSQDLRLVVSARKTRHLASSSVVVDGRVALWRPLKFVRKAVARSLGTDWSVGKARRAPAAKRRIRICLRRSSRLRALRRAGASTGHA